MELPGKNFLKKTFAIAAAGLGLTGCAVTSHGPYGHVGVYVPPPPPVYVTPVYPVYPVYRAPVIVVPAHPGHHHHHGGWGHRHHHHR